MTKEMRRYWKLKDEALDCILRRTRFEKYYGPLARNYVLVMVMVVVVVNLKERCQQEDLDLEGKILLNCGS
jgi:hypothetical protein